ncbi:esterase [Oryctes borbonicus]|uniref:Esterase n=1 Tax=Oryctes borbonicus TaxID=1629725 RepID=A0A0T6BE26_9SCAR|nr:esterase [Oryctes borbonicus]
MVCVYMFLLKADIFNSLSPSFYNFVQIRPMVGDRTTLKYPVMVFVHGESYEWNTGNAYDGSVLAAFGKVIVITLNFRLGILGFLKAGFLMDSKTNFGLIDQIAALMWIRENIREFGGDPDRVTMFGHGTGAACISLLTLSPMVLPENKQLFKRAILMGGTALSDWALATKSRNVTYGIVHSVNCSSEDEALKACLRKKRLREIKGAVGASSPPYITRFGPVVDSFVIPNEPEKLMTNYTDLFHRYELLYGLTEVESINLLNPVYLLHGMLDEEFERELTDYMNAFCEFNSNICKIRTRNKYWYSAAEYRDSTRDVLKSRDVLLDILSDARSAAPMIRMARYHSVLNSQSYFYVFGHVTSSRNPVRNKSAHGDELPYVFGVPLDSANPHFRDRYTEDEKELSETIMTLWANFAYNGDPNVLPIHMHGTMLPVWPEFDIRSESYLHLDNPHSVRHHYRHSKMQYWNEEFPNLQSRGTIHETPALFPLKEPFPNIPPIIQQSFTTTERNQYTSRITEAKPHFFLPTKPKQPFGVRVTTTQPPQSAESTTNILITVGALFLLFNVIMFFYMYHKCITKRKRNTHLKRNMENHIDALEIGTEKVGKIASVGNGCSLMKIITSKSTRSDDTYEAVRTHESSSSRRKLTRQISSSTIDAHTKVRDWIAQEIVNKYSPKLFRKTRRQNSSEGKRSKNSKKGKLTEETSKEIMDIDLKAAGSNSTLGQSPTRPVSPVDNNKEAAKISMIPVHAHKPKKTEKISVAVDATPAGRGSSVMRQQPIELSKSLDYCSFDSGTDVIEEPLIRANTMDDLFSVNSGGTPSQKSLTSINVMLTPVDEPTIIRIDHGHGKSDGFNTVGRKLKTFDPDINVTSRDESEYIPPLTPEESLQTIKRRNFPKVLPDLPGENKQSSSHKRRSMPAPNHLFLPIPENPSLSQPNSPNGKNTIRCPPTPPPRISSSLAKNGYSPLMQSAPAIAQEPPLPEEPELTCNNLYVGPLIPSRENRKVTLKPADTYTFNNQPIYDNLNPKKTGSSDALPATKRSEPKVIIKPTISRQVSDPAKAKGPRVVVNDILMASTKHENDENTKKTETNQSSIPVLARQNSKKGQFLSVKNSNKESSSESTPSEGSDTGTVVKRM